MKKFTSNDVLNFFAWSDVLDYMVLRPLDHILPNWEASWNHEARRYEPEVNSFAEDLNVVIELIAACTPPARYHDHEDSISESLVRDRGWPIQKKGTRWIGADYAFILEQGSFSDLNQRDLISAASGRVHAALIRDQEHIDDMESSHMVMLTALMTIIIYHRHNNNVCVITCDNEEN